MVGQSKLIEDGFHFERRGEGCQDSKIMSKERSWLLLLDQKVLSSIHKYDELDWQTMDIPRGMKDEPMPLLFGERPGEASMNFKPITSGGSTPAWHSPKPATEPRNSADLALAMYCQEHGGWEHAKFSWLAILGMVPCTMVKHPHYGEGWYFVLGDIVGSALMAWPAEQVGESAAHEARSAERSEG